jgi:hypothetical protein
VPIRPRTGPHEQAVDVQQARRKLGGNPLHDTPVRTPPLVCEPRGGSSPLIRIAKTGGTRERSGNKRARKGGDDAGVERRDASAGPLEQEIYDMTRADLPPGAGQVDTGAMVVMLMGHLDKIEKALQRLAREIDASRRS